MIATLITPEGAISPIAIATFADIQRYVHGYVELAKVEIEGKVRTVAVNEDGQALGLAENRAFKLKKNSEPPAPPAGFEGAKVFHIGTFSDYLLGNVIVLPDDWESQLQD